MPKPPPVTPVYAHVHNAVLQYELARKAFVTTLNDLLAAGDPGQTDALLRAGVVNLLHAPLVQGACPKPAPISNSSPGRSPAQPASIWLTEYPSTQMPTPAYRSPRSPR